MGRALRVAKVITEVFNVIAICALVFLLSLVFVNSMLRYIFNSPIPGAFELTRMGMICLTPCMAVTIINKKCVWVDVFASRFNRAGQLILDAVTLPAAGIIWGLIAWQCYKQIFRSIDANVHFTSIKLYEWPFRVVFFIAMSAATLAIIAFAAERLSKYAGGGMPHDESEVEQAIKRAEQMDVGEEVENA